MFPSKENRNLYLIGLGAVLAILLGAYLAYGDTPLNIKHILSLVEGWYARYGYLTVFVAAFLEGLFPLCFYIPGSTSIVIGIVFAQRAGLSLGWFTALIILGFFLAYCINYATGRYGVYKLLDKLGYSHQIKEVQQRLQDRGPKMLFGALFHSSLGAISSTAAGVIRMPLLAFIQWTLLGVVFWDLLWVGGLYFVGDTLIELASSWYAIPFVLAWSLLAVFLLPRTKKS